MGIQAGMVRALLEKQPKFGPWPLRTSRKMLKNVRGNKLIEHVMFFLFIIYALLQVRPSRKQGLSPDFHLCEILLLF